MRIDDYLLMIDEIQLVQDIRYGILNEDAIFDKASFRNPIYIVLMNGKSPLSNVIAKITGDTYTHACIAFNSKLDPLYSFGNKGIGQDGKVGFSKSNPQDRKSFPKEGSYYQVYVTYVTDIALSMMRERLEWFEKNAEKLKFDFSGLLNIFFGRDSENHEEKYFCSRFVMEILSQGIQIDKLPSLYRPQEMAKLDCITLVNKGNDIHYYDKSITDKNERLIKSYRSNKIIL